MFLSSPVHILQYDEIWFPLDSIKAQTNRNKQLAKTHHLPLKRRPPDMTIIALIFHFKARHARCALHVFLQTYNKAIPKAGCYMLESNLRCLFCCLNITFLYQSHKSRSGAALWENRSTDANRKWKFREISCLCFWARGHSSLIKKHRERSERESYIHTKTVMH